MELQEFRKKRLNAAMESAGADILIATMPANISYLTGGYVSVMQTAMAQAECAVGYVPADGSLFYIVGYSELPTVYEFAGTAAEVYLTGGKFCFEKEETCRDKFETAVMVGKEKAYETTSKAWGEAVRAHKGKGAIVAVDEMGMFPSLYKAIEQELASYKVVLGNNVFKEARRVKHPEEIEGIRRAAVAASESLMSMLHDYHPGMTEYDLRKIYSTEIVRRGAFPCYGVITAGKRAAYSDTVADRKRKIMPGDVLRFDFGCILDGYASDLARTAFVGEPDKKTALYYNAIREGCNEAVKAVKPGTHCSDIFKIAVETTRKAGIPHYRRHHCGHGIGLEMYDLYSITPDSEDYMEKDMTFCIETPYYELGWGGVQLEHTVAVTENGFELFDKTSDDLFCL